MVAGRPIRICHLASGDLWAGAEVQIATLLRALRSDATLDLSAIVLNRGRLAEELAAAGIPVTIYDESAGALKTLRSLLSHLNRYRPDILHSHRYKEHILGAFASKLLHNSLVVQTYHGMEEHLHGWSGLKMGLYATVNTIVGKALAEGFIGVSEEITAMLRQRYPSGVVRCIRNGIDLTRVRAMKSGSDMRDQLGIAAEEFVIGTVGRLAPVKGIEYVIRALAKSRASPRKRLVIVGDGPLRRELEKLADEVEVADKILFLGARSDVYELMGMFNVLALPSLHEGVPMVLLEAMAVGVPIVASRVGGIPEILTDGQEAHLIPAKDDGALSCAIDAMACDAALCDRLRKAGRAQVESRFSIGTTAALTGDLYRELVHNASERA